MKDIKVALFCWNPQRVSLPVPLHISGPMESYFEIPEPHGARSIREPPNEKCSWIPSSPGVFEVVIIHLRAPAWDGSQPRLAWQPGALGTWNSWAWSGQGVQPHLTSFHSFPDLVT